MSAEPAPARAAAAAPAQTHEDRLEVSLLGALLFDPNLIPLADVLEPGDFSTDPRAAIFRVLRETRQRGETRETLGPCNLLSYEARLLEHRAPVPVGANHWFTVLSRCVDFAMQDGSIDEEYVPWLVRQVAGRAAVRRAMRARA